MADYDGSDCFFVVADRSLMVMLVLVVTRRGSEEANGENEDRKSNWIRRIPIEIVKRLGNNEGISWMTSVMRDIQKTGIPAAWRQSRITPLYKQKGDPLNCSNYRGIKLLWERIIEGRLRDIVQISKWQYGFQKGHSTTEPMFCLRMLQEKNEGVPTGPTHGLMIQYPGTLFGTVYKRERCLRCMSS